MIFGVSGTTKESFYVCVLTIHSATKLNNGQDIPLTTDLLDHNQYITCYVMCDEIGGLLLSVCEMVSILIFSIAGTMRYAELRPGLPASIFPPTSSLRVPNRPGTLQHHGEVSKQYSNGRGGEPVDNLGNDEFSDDGLNDQDLLHAGNSAYYLLDLLVHLMRCSPRERVQSYRHF